MDDDVEYLGTKFASDDPIEVHPALTGITLHVDKCGDKPAHGLTFYRARSGYVNIGRKSGSDDRSMRRANDDHNAVFSCQVVSARHAKLVFSDAGQVYIVDLHSRHGTHLLKRGEQVSRMLQPEVETPLADGDLLTLGKAVGAGSYHVSPVTIRVELLSDNGLSSEPFKVRALTPFDAQSPVLSRPRKLSSGRYGLISQAAISCVELSDSPHSSSSSISASSDAPSSPSEQGSDLEDEHGCLPAMLRDAQEKASVKIPAFRSFIRDIYHTTISQSPVVSDIPGEPLEDEAPSSIIIRQPSPVTIVEPLSMSRSHSPMEVATPSPSPSPSPPPEAHHSDPAIIGAWPASRPESPRHSSLEVEIPRSEVPPVTESERQEHEPILITPPVICPNRMPPISNDAFVELIHRLPPPPPFFPIGGPFSNSIASDFGLPPIPHPPPPPPPPPPVTCRIPPFHPLHKAMTDCVSSEVKGTFKSVEDRISALQETVSDLRSRQTVTEEDMVDIQSHFETLEPDSLLCRIAGAERNIATLSMLQGQINALQNQVATMRRKLEVPEPKTADGSKDDFKFCADALSSLVSEMRSLREDVENRIEAKMETIQKARTEALDVLKEVIGEAEYVRSSKRKRDDEMEDEPSEIAVPQDVPVTYIPLETRVDTSVQQVHSSAVDVSPAKPDDVYCDEPLVVEVARPKKRARTAMYTVAHTAAAMAIGAAAAWSALAFS